MKLFASQLRFSTLEMETCVLCNCYMDETTLDSIQQPKLLEEIGSAQ